MHGQPENTPERRFTVCVVADCGRRHIARGLCAKHYQQARKGVLPNAPSFDPKQPSLVCAKGHPKEGVRIFSSGNEGRYCKVCAKERAAARAAKRPRKPIPTLEERFWRRVDRRGPDECWPWTGHLGVDGYGVLWRRRRVLVRAHRLSLQFKLGRDLPSEVCACHTCDNRVCVNPAHLVEGTRADNNRDMFAKGRGRPKGLTLPPRTDLPILGAEVAE
jgi:hypothetical protein